VDKRNKHQIKNSPTKNANKLKARLRKEASSKRNNPFKRENPTIIINGWQKKQYRN
jgi:hypothetical protein